MAILLPCFLMINAIWLHTVSPPISIGHAFAISIQSMFLACVAVFCIYLFGTITGIQL